MSGKGDTPRPVSVRPFEYAVNWRRTFGPHQEPEVRDRPKPPESGEVREAAIRYRLTRDIERMICPSAERATAFAEPPSWR
jgi:hypothetical protein